MNEFANRQHVAGVLPVRAGSSAMLKQENRKIRKKAYELPRLAVGDVLLVGKFKNRRATITGFSSDENNQPVAQN